LGGFPGSSAGKESTCNLGDLGSIPGSGRSPEGGQGNPLQYSCLGNLHGQRSLAGYGPRGHRVTAERLQHCAGYVVGAGTVSVEMNYYRKRLICPPPHMGPL